MSFTYVSSQINFIVYPTGNTVQFFNFEKAARIEKFRDRLNWPKKQQKNLTHSAALLEGQLQFRSKTVYCLCSIRVLLRISTLIISDNHISETAKM